MPNNTITSSPIKQIMPSQEDIFIETKLSDINHSLAERKIKTLAEKLKLNYVDISLRTFNPDLLRQLNFDEVEKTLALPFFVVGKKMRIAVADPEKIETKDYLDRLKAQHFQIQINLVDTASLLAKITSLKSIIPQTHQYFENTDANLDLQTYENEIHTLEDLEKKAYELSAETILNRIFIGALRCNASDIHFEPGENSFIIRFRIDGILQSILTFSLKKGQEISDQLKYQSHLRLNVKNLPQDGRTNFLASGRTIDVRVNSLPITFGESIACRLLDSGKKILTPKELGFYNTNLRQIEEASTLQNGLVLLTGPTGSGKTTTLYAILAQLNKNENKIITLEDPVEYKIPGIIQSQIDEENGFTFMNGLKSLLRQDPDIIMVGEIRDQETAEIAAQSAMTGHLVLSTLHTNSALEAIPRLANLGLSPYLLATSLKLIIAQRLVRRIHNACAKKVVPTQEEIFIFEKNIEILKKINPKLNINVPDFLWEPIGCPVCNHTGYFGQIAIIESFRFDEEISKLILRNASKDELLLTLRQKQKMLTLTEDGIIKVCLGITTLAEIASVTMI